jgi:hypothetical protein
MFPYTYLYIIIHRRCHRKQNPTHINVYMHILTHPLARITRGKKKNAHHISIHQEKKKKRKDISAALLPSFTLI